MPIIGFIGRAKTAIDDKGRTSFPREFRRALTPEDGREVVVTIGPQGSLILFTAPEWERYTARLEKRPRTRENLNFISLIHNSANISELDGQNRISLTRVQMDYAGLTSEVVFAAGMGKTLELWSPENFERMYPLQTPSDREAFDKAFYDDMNEEPRQ